MRLSEFRAYLLTYHVERGDPQGRLLSHELRRRADQRLEGEQVGSPQSAQLKRSQELFKALQSQHPRWIRSIQGVSATPRHLVLMITLGSFFVGWGGQALGADARFHLLSPVLLTLIVWNGVSLALMLFVSVRARPEAHDHDEKHGSVHFKPHTTQLDRLAQLQGPQRALHWALKLWRWLKIMRGTAHEQGERHALQNQISVAFLEAWVSDLSPYILSGVRRMLHLSALSLAIGVLAGAYWDGLTQAYQATRSSTFLSAQGVEWILSVVLAPSTIMMGPITLSDGANMSEGLAASWVHRYAFTILCVVILPRFALIVWERQLSQNVLQSLQSYLSLPQLTPTLNVALASHTNLGKTSLARTLLRRDVGEVRDERNVTKERSAYYLIKAPEGRLLLWDTPGFDDPERLARALTTQAQPWRWLKREASEAERLDFEAASALYEESDAIVYLLPVAPSEGELRQMWAEWSVLRLINKPVVCVLNRMRDREEAGGLDPLGQWRQRFEGEPLCVGIISLDAHHRSLKEERAFYQALTSATPPEKRALAEHVYAHYLEGHQGKLSAISTLIYKRLKALIDERVTRTKRSFVEAFKKTQTEDESLQGMSARALTGRAHFLTQLCDILGLEGELKDSFEDLHEHLQQELTSSQEGRRRELGVWGAVVSGLISGLGADLMAGGLTLGGGMIAGGIAGLLTGMGAAELHSHLTHEGKVTRWDRAFIEREYLSMLSMTLIASSFGRARGQLSMDYDQASVETQLTKLIEDQRLQGPIDQLYRSAEEDRQCVALIEELLADLL